MFSFVDATSTLTTEALVAAVFMASPSTFAVVCPEAFVVTVTEVLGTVISDTRSEERRVGKECISRLWPLD